MKFLNTIRIGAVALGSIAIASAHAQPRAPVPLPDASTTSPGAPHRMRLILKDGSYQIILSYTIKGSIVSYISAERGDTEELPADLVDWTATKKWQQQHSATDEADPTQPPAIDPELLKEEADRRALNPEVAPDLNLPDLDSVLALDYFHGDPELVPLVQTDGDLNRTTGHNVLKLALNPRAAQHQIVALKGIQAAVQLHVPQPVLYLRIGDDTIARGGTPFVVNTHGAAANSPSPSQSTPGSASSTYVIVRADIRTDSRILASFNIGALGDQLKRQPDVIATTSEPLPGGHWLKITPSTPLDFGEYALIEIISDREINLGVWDFGIHPVAPENRDIIKPQPKHPITLERRSP
jgi:hypothetical protein